MTSNEEWEREFDKEFIYLDENDDRYLLGVWDKYRNVGTDNIPAIKDFINCLIKNEKKKITYDAVSPTWVNEDPAWTLIAIQDGKVIWQSENPVTKSMIQSQYYNNTGKYAYGVCTQEHVVGAAEIIYKSYLQRKDKEE